MAVVRVKRRSDEDPVDALLLTCKRRKTEDDHFASIFTFATTLNNQDENVSKHISKACSSDEARAKFKLPNISNITEKIRTENKIFSQKSRLKVVNCFRALSETDSLDDSDGASANNGSLTVVDIESQSAVSSDDTTTSTLAVADIDDGSQKFVYDIYYAPDCDIDEKELDNLISCHAIDNLAFDDYANEIYDDEDDSDDSNEEGNWRNDYPDEDPDSIGEEDMKLACEMGDLNISDRNSLSSDEGEADFVYGMDDPDYIPGVDPALVKHFGYNYAAYKKRVTEVEDSDQSDNSDFYYANSDAESDQT